MARSTFQNNSLAAMRLGRNLSFALLLDTSSPVPGSSNALGSGIEPQHRYEHRDDQDGSSNFLTISSLPPSSSLHKIVPPSIELLESREEEEEEEVEVSQ
ncbi:unnamed protein product [Timema podura]|uniref:Uncharacterized protein n=1 Tax=Timema podura TaxID=61482 RepID=A0ABN7NFT5_TIMPD|nr:unnamed protein product [Timema podura]